MRLTDLREDATTHETIVVINKCIKKLNLAYFQYKIDIEILPYKDAARKLQAVVDEVTAGLWIIQMTLIGDRKIEAAYQKLDALLIEINGRLECGI